MKIKNKISIVTLFAFLILGLNGCEDMFEPAPENHKKEEDL